MTTNLSALTAAAEKWEEMSSKFRTLGTLYGRDVHGISLGEAWTGASATAGHDRFTVTLEEIAGAQSEAKAMGSLLRQAHTQLVDLRARVEAVRADAIKDGMRVSDRGTVTFDTSQLTRGERTAYVHDPEFQEIARAKAEEWEARIKDAVKAVSDADDGIRLMLQSITRDSDPMDGTIDGFNRHPQPNPYPSLEEAGKAANMPEGKRAVAEWWRDLDPVTRGILWQERAEELLAAGVTAPLYDWKTPDVGSGPWGVEEVTPRDVRLHALALAIATAGDIKGEVGASRNMLHYLDGTGETLCLDVNRMLHDDAGLRDEIEQNHLAHHQQSWRQQALEEFYRSGGDKPIAVPVESTGRGETLKSDEWFHAIGSHMQNVSGVVTVTPGSDGRPPNVSLDYQVNIWDRYNWDNGKATTFPGGITIEDKDMGRLHKVGIAREFDMMGSSTVYTYDLDSHDLSGLTPSDPGREGTRADGSRGDEENR
ncbi:hypothetical protein [Streptomyces sp. NPDC005012]|uniref:hypothetical protein n=1 Tax=Streptomyces sp. NPDC005012 TaxID=3154558 RepID=UPI0033B0E175